MSKDELLSRLAIFDWLRWITAIAAVISALGTVYWICRAKRSNKNLTEMLINEVESAFKNLKDISNGISEINENSMLDHELRVPSTPLFSANINKLEHLDKQKASSIKLLNQEIKELRKNIIQSNELFRDLNVMILEAGICRTDIDFSGMTAQGYRPLTNKHSKYIASLNMLKSNFDSKSNIFNEHLAILKKNFKGL